MEGLDLCLHMVRRDLGAATAADAARAIVMPPQRSGGQAQFIEHRDPEGDPDDLAPALQWMHDNLDKPLTLADIAAQAAMSTRSLSRRFRARLGMTPLQWLLDQRVRRARELLETTGLPVERIARITGFGSVEALRHHFARQVGLRPRNPHPLLLTLPVPGHAYAPSIHPPMGLVRTGRKPYRIC
ncbi:GlxA family transcriptional regulator [Spongiactinospora sp. 9N601]|uniref:GlxA family transcriptional regulator n=1 Tax=Spongiactinospora sp. 9N601 TaxID=3375149 RepID=UPI0037A80896